MNRTLGSSITLVLLSLALTAAASPRESVSALGEPLSRDSAAGRLIAWTVEGPGPGWSPRVLLASTAGATSAEIEPSAGEVSADGLLLALAAREARAELIVLEPDGRLALRTIAWRPLPGPPGLEILASEGTRLGQVLFDGDEPDSKARWLDTALSLELELGDVALAGQSLRIVSWWSAPGELSWVELTRNGLRLPIQILSAGSPGERAAAIRTVVALRLQSASR